MDWKFPFFVGLFSFFGAGILMQLYLLRRDLSDISKLIDILFKFRFSGLSLVVDEAYLGSKKSSDKEAP